MRILVARRLDQTLVDGGLGPLVVYRPTLANSEELRRELCHVRPAALLVDGEPDDDALTAWRNAAGTRRLVIIRTGNGTHCTTRGHGIETRDTGGDDTTALAMAEAHVAHCLAEPRLMRAGLSRDARPVRALRRVLLVGAGIVNLITAWQLREAGYDLDVVDAAPDPRTRPDWRLLGATHGGGNARMFTLTEADNYNEKASRIYSGMQRVLRRRITEGGWLVSDEHSPAESVWLDRFHALPPWLAEVFTRDIYAVNRESMALWQSLRRRYPALFRDVELIDGILRIYSEEHAFEAAAALHDRVGSLVRVLDREATARNHPAYAEACANGEIAGGLEVVGFTLNVHDFVDRLLAELEARGVRFHWSEPARGIAYARDGAVEGIETIAALRRSDHYVLSPGVACDRWLGGTRTEGKVQGIFGLWLTLPNVAPRLRHSVKLHREGHVGEDSNITIARDDLLLGSGYGFSGGGVVDMAGREVGCLFDALHETARRFHPRGYALAVAQGTLDASRKACIRPFTATGLGIFEVIPAAGGGRLVITTGHNTGGFTQAPSVANAVLTTIDGRLHPMQELYDPDRGFDRAGQAAEVQVTAGLKGTA